VDILYSLDHLIGQHEYGLEGELAPTHVEEVLE
jgi:hypothetical protein